MFLGRIAWERVQMWEGAGCWKNSEKVSMGEVGELLLFSRSVVSNSFETPWTAVCQGPLSMGCSRQEYWSGLSFPSPGDLSDPGIEPTSPDSLPLSHLGSQVSFRWGQINCMEVYWLISLHIKVQKWPRYRWSLSLFHIVWFGNSESWLGASKKP